MKVQKWAYGISFGLSFVAGLAALGGPLAKAAGWLGRGTASVDQDRARLVRIVDMDCEAKGHLYDAVHGREISSEQKLILRIRKGKTLGFKLENAEVGKVLEKYQLLDNAFTQFGSSGWRARAKDGPVGPMTAQKDGDIRQVGRSNYVSIEQLAPKVARKDLNLESPIQIELFSHGRSLLYKGLLQCGNYRTAAM